MSGNYFGFQPAVSFTALPQQPPVTYAAAPTSYAHPPGTTYVQPPPQQQTYAYPAGVTAVQPVAHAGFVTATAAPVAYQVQHQQSAVVSQPQPTGNTYDAAVYAAATNFIQAKVVSAGTVSSGSWGQPNSGSAGRGSTSGTTTSNQGSAGGASGGFRGGNNFQNRNNHGRGGFGGGGNNSGGGGGGNFGGGRGRGRGGFRGGHNNNQDRPPKEPQQMFYCESCKISCAGPQTYKEHNEGQRHKKKVAQIASQESRPLPRHRTSYRCDLCLIVCTCRDTYDAHVKGVKHMKTVKLHQSLGKPVPSSEPTIIPSQTKLNMMRESDDIVLPPMKPGAMISAAEAAEDAIDEDNIQPVGEDYIEVIGETSGKSIIYSCKLCDCKFNDNSAKDLHLKGRRHRLSYKKKVNPELVVEMKMTSSARRIHEQRMQRMMFGGRGGGRFWGTPGGPGFGPPFMGPGGPGGFGGPPQHGPFGVETMDDHHVLFKHDQIYPTEQELTAVQKLVINTEKALKGVSDRLSGINANAAKKADAKAEGDKAAKEGEKKDATKDATAKDGDKDKEAVDRVLKGVMRVGLLAKGLLLRGDKNVQLVVLCADKPSRTLLTQIIGVLPAELKAVDETSTTSCALWQEQAAITVTETTPNVPQVKVTISFTSVKFREEEEQAAAAKAAAEKKGEKAAAPPANTTDPVDVLDKAKCLDALAELRHAKWFQALELLVEKVLTSACAPLQPADALRRVFEAIASGVLLRTGHGVIDPCEKDMVDAIAYLTEQQREDITSSAQHALRLCAFNQLYKILGIERIRPDQLPNPRKRRHGAEGAEGEEETEEKKEKLEGGDDKKPEIKKE